MCERASKKERGIGVGGGRQADRQGEGDTTQASLRPQPPCCAACAARRSFSRQANVEPPIIREKLRHDSRSLVSEGRNAAGGVVKKERKGTKEMFGHVYFE